MKLHQGQQEELAMESESESGSDHNHEDGYAGDQGDQARSDNDKDLYPSKQKHPLNNFEAIKQGNIHHNAGNQQRILQSDGEFIQTQ